MTVYAGIIFEAELATAVSPMGLRTCDLGGLVLFSALRPRAQELASDTCSQVPDQPARGKMDALSRGLL